jgi:ACS family glucarate transporter-like MFS transporter
MTADLAVPPKWAYCQDVGGRNAAACLAWPNMWGNIGAMIGPLLLGWVNRTFDTNHDWHESLLVMSAALVLCGATAFFIRADKKIEGTDGDEAPPSPAFPVIMPAAESPAPAQG